MLHENQQYTDPKNEIHNRNFYRLRRENSTESGLTEIYGGESTERVFMHSDNFGHWLRYLYIAKQMIKLKPNTVLDVGCGSLQLPYVLHRNRFAFGAEYYGLDLRDLRTYLSRCQLKANVTVIQCDVLLDDPSLVEIRDGTSAKLMPAHHEVVVCLETFEHVPRDTAHSLMNKLFNWTAPGGYCFFSTPNAGVSDSTADNHVGADGISREWTYSDKIRLATDAGFIIEESYGVFGRQDRIKPAMESMPWIVTDPVTKKFVRLDNMWNHPIVQSMKSFVNHSVFIDVMCANFPELSNNALFKMRRPL